MRNFKIFFYGVYFIFFGFCAFVATNYESLVLHWDWDPIDTWTSLIRFVLQIGGIGLILFGIEMVVENIDLFSKRRKIKSLEKEVSAIKVKLYDLSQKNSNEIPKYVSSGDDNSMEEQPEKQQDEQND